MTLKDKIAVVSEAANEKGRAIPKSLAKNGVKIVAHY